MFTGACAKGVRFERFAAWSYQNTIGNQYHNRNLSMPFIGIQEPECMIVKKLEALSVNSVLISAGNQIVILIGDY